jgi:hypothetical protein
MGISQSELSFGIMQFCLPSKKHMVKTAGKDEFAGSLPQLELDIAQESEKGGQDTGSLISITIFF